MAWLEPSGALGPDEVHEDDEPEECEEDELRENMR